MIGRPEDFPAALRETVMEAVSWLRLSDAMIEKWGEVWDRYGRLVEEYEAAVSRSERDA